MTAGPDGVRNPASSNDTALESGGTERVLWIVGSTDCHLIQRVHPGIDTR
jgi:hypothetical protein